MNASELARLILDWEDRQRRADSAAEAIKAVVLAGGKTVTVGNVRASYSGGRFDYQAVAEAKGIPLSILEANTTMKPVVDWLTICAHLGIDISSISSEPEVTMKLLEVERWIPFM